MGPAHQLSGLGGALGSWPSFPVSCSQSIGGGGVTCLIHLPLASPSGILCPLASLVMSSLTLPSPRQPDCQAAPVGVGSSKV